MNSRILAIKQFGQQIWLDNLSRELLYSGELERLIQEDGISGVTSNPTIFHKAIGNDPRYQIDLEQLKQTSLSPEERYEALVIPDIQKACDIFLPLYESSNKEEGYVSFELSPHLANNSTASIEHAKRLWHTINRPNLMIKIPATTEGVKALEVLITDGININITLLFSLNQVVHTWEAYIRGLKNRLANNLSIEHIKAVASFFLSRIDNAIDSKLAENIQGKVAISLAKMAYLKYQEIFNSSDFAQLKIFKAKPQYLLWASTGTKNANFSDVMYVEELIGQETINTVPDTTLKAFRNHGTSAASMITSDTSAALHILKSMAQYNVDLENLGEKLQQAGLESFMDSFNSLIEIVK